MKKLAKLTDDVYQACKFALMDDVPLIIAALAEQCKCEHLLATNIKFMVAAYDNQKTGMEFVRYTAQCKICGQHEARERLTEVKDV